VDDRLDEERAARIRAARQVLAGTDIRSPEDPLRFGHAEALVGPVQFAYLVGLVGLFVLGLIVWAVAGLMAASPVLFVLALGLLIGWIVLAHR